MWPFWLMFALPAWGLLSPRSLPPRQSAVAWAVVGLVFTLLIGFRDQVGGDWFTYLPMFERAAQMGFGEAMSAGDPGHYVLNRLVAELGGHIYAVNLIYAVVLMSGTVVFCRRQPYPWLALLVAVPYMLIVVGMGYTRQSVALGFALLGLVALGDGRVRSFVLWIALGALFHKSAVLLLPIAALASSRNRLLTGLLVLVATVLMYYLLLSNSADDMWKNYVEADMASDGGPIRVAMNALPAVLLILFRQRLVPDPNERKLWLWMAIFALACVPVVGIASTAVDRVALYLIPLQLFLFSRLPQLAYSNTIRTSMVLGIVAYYGAVEYVWLNFATHAKYWEPYQFMPLS